MHKNLGELGINKSQFEDSIQSEVSNLINEMCSLKGEAFAPSRLLTTAVSNIICSIAFDKRYSYSDPEFRRLLDIIAIISGFPVSASALGTIPALRHIPFGPHAKYIRCFKDFHDTLDGIIAYRKEKGLYQSGQVSSLLDAYLLELENQAQGKGILQIPIQVNTVYSNIGALFFAGSETIVTTLCWALIFLIRNPRVQAKCHAELDQVIGRDRNPRLGDRERLPYIEAVIAEVLRLGDTTPVGVPHSASCDIQFHGYTIPEKAMIIPNLHAIMYDETYWENPMEFVPERFLNQDGHFVKSSKLIPFGTGLCFLYN